MQPSTYDIQREVEALRDIRRRSITPGALTIDPDLPNPTSPTSSTYASWSGASQTDDSSNSSHEDSSSTDHTTVETDNPADDPFHLFWVPASVHPEIAPAEFREFLREHSRSPPPGDGSPIVRSGSFSSVSSGLGRKKSMLSRQYRPSENDGVEEQEEKIVPLSRNRSTRYTNQGPQLTISDLQKLEELAEEASQSDDPSKLRNILRRSLSLNVSPTAIEEMKNMPEMGDEADAPIIVPPRGQILRRSARTKIRKPGLPGDGGGHRFGATRRKGRSTTAPAERTSSDHSSSEHGEQEIKASILSDEFQQLRPQSFSEEASIYDAYAANEEEEVHPSSIIVTSSPPPAEEVIEAPRIPSPQPEEPPAEPAPTPLHQPDDMLHHPQPQRLLSPQVSTEPSPPSRTPSPSSSIPETSSPPSFLSSPPPQQHRKEKDKKGLFGKWGSDKSGKKAKDHARTESHDRAEKEKESGFFGSLFGGKKNKDSDSSAPPSSAHSHAAGREAAQALLGASKSSKSYQPPPSPGAQAINNYSRYPIHVERAIYRLSHIKLANPRRPLYEQVLISNLMFWYLGVINKAQNPQTNGQAGVGAGAQGEAGATSSAAEKEQEKEKEQREAEQRERQERERQEREQREQREMEMEMKKQREVSPKRGPLTKPAPMGAGGGRRAEIPIKGPQYEMQHREMEQVYGGYSGSAPPQSTPQARSLGHGQRPSPSSQLGAPRQGQSADPSQGQEQFYYSPDMIQNQPPQQTMYSQQQQQRLPPGAMAPMEQSWSASGSPRQQTGSPPPQSNPQRRSRSPPPNPYNTQHQQQGMYSGGRTPGRSLSATAVPSSSPPNANGRLRKGVSAHAVPPKARPRTPESQYQQQPQQRNVYQPNGMAEEEDMPLAVWQQQRRR
ncbi:hypothetical protein GYMLUDRAFT_244409 [Collybiopsis luxurians FD-317 M1]|uniref:Protein Zds1 C-terminal domain-containing protein n=1 Tax=Collybiopsis luxurians FD-317 M1 TaxID=944289 RepID=A0A0D0BXJ1_9AGAR|nr:hypothetical protein GYMLUDRAFT_244409 [Collybiopsis luxurians FD-317 M1]